MRYVRETKVAELTGISVKCLQSQRQKGGGIPFVKIGRLVRYDLDVVEAYLKTNTYLSTTQFSVSKNEQSHLVNNSTS